MEMLRERLVAAETEIERKMRFVQLITDATAHLREGKAVSSLSEANEANGISANGDEVKEATEWIEKATTERDRQKRVKQQMQLAIQCLEDADPKTARKHCKDALAIEDDPATNEHIALDHLEQACAFWIAGNEALDAWRGEDAKESFESANASASAAATTAESDGYFEYETARMELSTVATDMLRERLVAAETEIERKADFSKNVRRRADALDKHGARHVEMLQGLSGDVERLERIAKSPSDYNEIFQATSDALKELNRSIRSTRTDREICNQTTHHHRYESIKADMAMFQRTSVTATVDQWKAKSPLVQRKRPGNGSELQKLWTSEDLKDLNKNAALRSIDLHEYASLGEESPFASLSSLAVTPETSADSVCRKFDQMKSSYERVQAENRKVTECLKLRGSISSANSSLEPTSSEPSIDSACRRREDARRSFVKYGREFNTMREQYEARGLEHSLVQLQRRFKHVGFRYYADPRARLFNALHRWRRQVIFYNQKEFKVTDVRVAVEDQESPPDSALLHGTELLHAKHGVGRYISYNWRFSGANEHSLDFADTDHDGNKLTVLEGLQDTKLLHRGKICLVGSSLRVTGFNGVDGIPAWPEDVQLHRTRFTDPETDVSEPIEMVAEDEYNIKPLDPNSQLKPQLVQESVLKSSQISSAGVRISRGVGPSFTVGKYTIICNDQLSEEGDLGADGKRRVIMTAQETADSWLRRLERRSKRLSQVIAGVPHQPDMCCHPPTSHPAVCDEITRTYGKMWKRGKTNSKFTSNLQLLVISSSFLRDCL